jgi:Ca2+-binding EF-hand superfamily protein
MQAIFMKAQPDRNLEGEVTQAQISVCLPLEMQEKLTDEAFAAMDKDNSGTFDYGEIKDILARCSNAKEDKKMRLLFDRIDKDKSGSITATELQGVLPYVITRHFICWKFYI